MGRCIYPRIHHAWCLNQDYLLKELDAAYSHARGGFVHSSQDVRFDGRHELPVLNIAGVGYTEAHSSMRECSHECNQTGAGIERTSTIRTACMMKGDLSEGLGCTYMCLYTSGYTLAAACTALLMTLLSSTFSRYAFSVASTDDALFSLTSDGHAGEANASARKSAPQRWISTLCSAL